MRTATAGGVATKTCSGELNHLNRGMPKLVITEDRKIYFVLLPLVAGVLLVLSGIARAQNCTDDGSGPYGSLLDHREFNQAVQALPPAAFLTPRSSRRCHRMLTSTICRLSLSKALLPALAPLAAAKRNPSAMAWALTPQRAGPMVRSSGSPRWRRSQ